MADRPEPETPFEAVLYPNPAMPSRAIAVLFVAVAAVSTALGAAFAMAGAWPVTGFLGLDIVLLALAFRVCVRRSRCVELIRLDEHGLHVCRRQHARPESRWRFEPYWVRVGMDDPPRSHSQLTLSSHGKRLRIGQFLTPDERLDVARALRRALADYHARPSTSLMP
jgi:uncharacterized membrane protein